MLRWRCLTQRSSVVPQQKGVTAVAIIVLVSSSLLFLFFLLALVGLMMGNPGRTAILGVEMLLGIFLVGIICGIGLLLRKVWARYLTMGSGFGFGGFFLFCIAVQWIGATNNPHIVTLSIGFILAGAASITVATYLSRRSVAELFEDPDRLASRPTGVLMAGWLMICWLLALPSAFRARTPLVVFTYRLHAGWRTAVMVSAIVLFAGTGLALLLRIRRAFWAAMALQALGFTNGVINIVLLSRSALAHEFGNSLLGPFWAIVPANALLIFIVPLASLFIGQNKFFQIPEPLPSQVVLEQPQESKSVSV